MRQDSPGIELDRGNSNEGGDWDGGKRLWPRRGSGAEAHESGGDSDRPGGLKEMREGGENMGIDGVRDRDLQ